VHEKKVDEIVIPPKSKKRGGRRKVADATTTEVAPESTATEVCECHECGGKACVTVSKQKTRPEPLEWY